MARLPIHTLEEGGRGGTTSRSNESVTNSFVRSGDSLLRREGNPLRSDHYSIRARVIQRFMYIHISFQGKKEREEAGERPRRHFHRDRRAEAPKRPDRKLYNN